MEKKTLKQLRRTVVGLLIANGAEPIRTQKMVGVASEVELLEAYKELRGAK